MDTRLVTTASGIGRREVLTAGVGAALALATLTEDAVAATAAKNGQRYCSKCRGLFAGKGNESVGSCPAGGSHKPAQGYDYLLLSGLSVTHSQLFKNWFQCTKCRGLFADDLGDTGVCPKGGAHKRTGPAYAMWFGTSLPFMDTGWRESFRCFGMYWAGTGNGVCPDGGEHQPRSENYALLLLR